MTAAKLMDDAFAESPDAAWLLVSEGYDELRDSSVASRFAISNGFLGVRGERTLTRPIGETAEARTYVAGLFDTLNPSLSTPGLVQAADWLQVHLSLPDGPLVRHPGEVASQRRTLEMKRGAVLSDSWVEAARSPGARLAMRARTLHLVSLRERALGQQLIQLDIEAGDVDLTLDAAFGGPDPGLVLESSDPNVAEWRTHRQGRRLVMATRSFLWIDGVAVAPTTTRPMESAWTWRSRAGQAVSFQRLVWVARSPEDRGSARAEALEGLEQAGRSGWRGVTSAHESAWSTRWDLSDVRIEGDAEAQQALRFAGYHLNGAANPSDEFVSIGARALTGDDYRGHVFWDTEIYLMPFYTMTWPEAARALLMYRFHTLGAARQKAARLGWRGALYAWESADTGEEATPPEVLGPDRQVIKVLSGVQEQHISADVAYAAWQYWRATADEAFMRDAGAEILLETGRFWASRARLEARDGGTSAA